MEIDIRLTVSICAVKNENLPEPQRQSLARLEDRIQRRGLWILPDSATSDDLEHR